MKFKFIKVYKINALNSILSLTPHGPLGSKINFKNKAKTKILV